MLSGKRHLIYLENILIALGYWGISYLNFILFKGLGFLPMPIWPAAALALLVSFYKGIKVAPGIAVGAILANHFALGSSWTFALCISIMNTLSPELIAYLLRKRLAVHFILYSFKNLCYCFFLAIVLAPILTAIGGIGSKYLLGLMPLSDFIISFYKWSIAHSLGTLFFASPIFIYFMNTRSKNFKDDYNESANYKIEHTIVLFSVFFSIYFWITDAALERLWFPKRGTSFLDLLFPINDLHEMYMRGIAVMAFITSGFAVFKVIQVLKKQQKQTISLAQNLSTTLDSIGDGVISTDKNGIINRLNPIAEKLTGWSSAEAVGKTMNEVFVIKNSITNDSIDNPIQKVIKSKRILSFGQNIVLISKYGEKFAVSNSAAPIISEAGELVGTILVFRDITEEVEIQQRLKHSQRMDAIGQLAGGVAHDFNNMLGGIIGFAELLAKKVESDKESSTYIEMIIDTSEKAAGLTKKLLAFAKKSNIPSTSVDMHTIIYDSVELLRRTIDKRIDLITNLNATNNFVVGDPSQLQNILINMGINAGYAIEQTGSISFSTADIYVTEDYISNNDITVKSGNYIEIKVTDTGRGIPKENLNKIFEPFFTTRENGKGTGLGLSAVYGTVQQHKGDIEVSSTIDCGTTFTVILPATNETVQKNTKVEIPPKCSSGNVLIVDDEYIMRLTATRILEEYGYNTTTACDGLEAIKLYKQAPNSFNLVILDMIMPGMNGKDCFQELQKINPEVKAILASGFSNDVDIKAMKDKGLKSFISKPYRSSELIEIVNKML